MIHHVSKPLQMFHRCVATNREILREGQPDDNHKIDGSVSVLGRKLQDGPLTAVEYLECIRKTHALQLPFEMRSHH